MSYDIYDLETANMVESFSTEEEALAMVRDAIDEYGPQIAELWGIARSDHTTKALYGQALLERALGSSTAASG